MDDGGDGMIEITITVDGILYDVRFDGDDVAGIMEYGKEEDIREGLDYAYLCRLEREADRVRIAEYGSEWDKPYPYAKAIARVQRDRYAARLAEQKRDDAMTAGSKA